MLFHFSSDFIKLSNLKLLKFPAIENFIFVSLDERSKIS